MLCDGLGFYFFKIKFVGQPRTCRAEPQVFLGKFSDSTTKQYLTEWTSETDPKLFIPQARLVCESLFYLFLSGYQNGLDAYLERSVENARKQGKDRESTQKWHNVLRLANETLDLATSAWDQRKDDKDNSERSAEKALELIHRTTSEQTHSKAVLRKGSELPQRAHRNLFLINGRTGSKGHNNSE